MGIPLLHVHVWPYLHPCQLRNLQSFGHVVVSERTNHCKQKKITPCVATFRDGTTVEASFTHEPNTCVSGAFTCVHLDLACAADSDSPVSSVTNLVAAEIQSVVDAIVFAQATTNASATPTL
jgi:hypothetical protein